jgi:hypothetical protein
MEGGEASCRLLHGNNNDNNNNNNNKASKQGVVSVEMRRHRKLISGRCRKWRLPFQNVASSGHFVTKLAHAN